MKSTREKILRTLLAYPRSTINDLAKAVGINGISIRHHLSNLEAENLVTSAEQRHGVGRPRLIYSLTEKGAEKFPTSYLRLTKRLLFSLEKQFSKETIVEIFEDIAKEVVEDYHLDLDGKSDKSRIKILESLLTKEGYIVNWEENEDHFTFDALSCPYLKVGFDHPEICTLDHKIITEFFDEPVEIKTCIFQGDERCTFLITKQNKETSNE